MWNLDFIARNYVILGKSLNLSGFFFLYPQNEEMGLMSLIGLKKLWLEKTVLLNSSITPTVKIFLHRPHLYCDEDIPSEN